MNAQTSKDLKEGKLIQSTLLHKVINDLCGAYPTIDSFHLGIFDILPEERTKVLMMEAIKDKAGFLQHYLLTELDALMIMAYIDYRYLKDIQDEFVTHKKDRLSVVVLELEVLNDELNRLRAINNNIRTRYGAVVMENEDFEAEIKKLKAEIKSRATGECVVFTDWRL